MKDEIQYEDFQKLDIRIGKIISAEKVPDTDKLLKCEVDFGEEVGVRTIVSGIAEHVSPSAVIGGKFPYIINLAPRIIRGIESQGMIMAIGGEHFSLLSPTQTDTPQGVSVS